MPADVSQLLAFAKFSRSVGRRVRTQVVKEVKNTTDQVEQDAKTRVPVLTGELRDSISGSARGLKGEVKTDLRYAQYVEYGYGHGPAQPFMMPAADRADEQFPADVEDAVVRALDAF